MSFDVDEDILQDFLIEASEILELLSEQLVDLEKSPEDSELLNAIFRGFHTVKGGAGFLALSELVDICHGAENVFDSLRNGLRAVTPELMDVILKSLDCVNEMFVLIQQREPLTAADPALIHQLNVLTQPESAPKAVVEPMVQAPVVAQVSTPITASSSDIDGMSELEFEQLLDELHGQGGAPSAVNVEASKPAPAVMPISSNSDFTDDEFEKLLDDLHGVGQHSIATPTPTPTPTPTVASNSTADLNDDDFENLLDELYGKGNAPSAVAAPVSAPAVKAEIATSTAVATPVAPVVKTAPEKAPVAKASEAAAKADKKAKPQADSTVRVDTRTLDEIMNMVGELVLVRNRLVSLGISSNDEDMTKAVSNLDVVTADLQGAVMKTRMQPIKKVFGRFPRVVRDLARTLAKDINLELIGEETDLDKNLVEALADPLVHLVRNSVDHGIEMPDVREKNGKPRQGNITLSASQEGDHISLKIVDDGAGMDAERLKQIAIDRGVLDADSAARISDNEAYNLIFAPGFSTKDQISDISGRGVGMDVVKTGISKLNGTISIDSNLGTGTTIFIKVPLTLAILPTLMVEVGKQIFALPLTSVNEIFHLDLNKTHVVDNQLTIIVREKAIPLFYLHDWLTKMDPQAGARNERGLGHVVIVQLGLKQVGFVVDSLIGQEEVVIKALDNLLQGTPGMAGATITSDGGIALILDIPSLLNHYAKR
ncbi:chemotaxis protein CheA [Moritella sp. F3]|uniref:chemotaxis protein CheA n=1 Tax=Moritella sp. F3 TaxID=2718882 RepID=UPI0018E0F21C|nr:chemotaxis protein CheA [Moritella sp. F3]GIC78034.1 chemotaxis protein CheA [Moritella sp. F1]GIC82565.1 chemotaxis protein CheA [Moritella sp. F3]